MTFSEHDVADLLAVYALDAVDPDEARRVEAHLAVCPRCRAEVATHRETAAYLAYSGTDAPEGIWARIGAEIASEGPRQPAPLPGIVELRSRRTRVPRRRAAAFASMAAVAALVVAFLSIDIAHLSNRVNSLQSASGVSNLTLLAISTLEGPHKSVVLTSESGRTTASVAVNRDGDAYWVGSSLADLPAGRTYQVWGNDHGRPVSLALLGRSAGRLATFRVRSGITELLVTAEPRGGTKVPTTPVLIAGAVPTAL
jgi:hypothetical protein